MQALWLVGANYRLSTKAERFLIEVGGTSKEVAARRVKAIVLDGEGEITSGALALAASQRIPVVVAGKQLAVVQSPRPLGYGELAIQQYEYIEQFREGLRKLLQRARRENQQEALRRLGFQEEDPEQLMKKLTPRTRRYYSYMKKLTAAYILAHLTLHGLNPEITIESTESCGLAWDLEKEFDGPIPLYATLQAILEWGEPPQEEAQFRRTAATAIDQRLNTHHQGKPLAKWIENQVKTLARACRTPIFSYQPFTWR